MIMGGRRWRICITNVQLHFYILVGALTLFRSVLPRDRLLVYRNSLLLFQSLATNLIEWVHYIEGALHGFLASLVYIVYVDSAKWC